jgi:prepilin-type N-terminal cleavage/methylation domain-containing protein
VQAARSAPPDAEESGFTLVELVIVLVVLAVASSLAIPAIRPALESVRMDEAVRRTASSLDDVRRRSVLERKVLVVRCDTRENRLGLVGDKPFPLPGQVALFDCSEEELRYYPQGSASGLTLTLRDGGGRERRLTVGAFTGLVRVDDPREAAAGSR